MSKGKGCHTLLFLRSHPICAGHATALIGWAALHLSVIVPTASLIRPAVTWLAAVPSKHNGPSYYIYFSATLLFRGGFLAATVKLFEIMSNWDLLFITTSAHWQGLALSWSPKQALFFSFFLCHLPAWTLYVLLCLRRSSHLKWAIYKMLFTNPTRKSSVFFSNRYMAFPLV